MAAKSIFFTTEELSPRGERLMSMLAVQPSPSPTTLLLKPLQFYFYHNPQ